MMLQLTEGEPAVTNNIVKLSLVQKAPNFAHIQSSDSRENDSIVKATVRESEDPLKD